MKSFQEFKPFIKDNIKITHVKYTDKELIKELKPIMCEVCRRIFNPTEEEKEATRKYLNDIDISDFTWEIKLKK